MLLDIEKELGRVREVKWGPRLIDIDILFFNDVHVDQNDVTIPHPELHKRSFVLLPLAELAPEFIHPLLQKNVQQMLQSLP